MEVQVIFYFTILHTFKHRLLGTLTLELFEAEVDLIIRLLLTKNTWSLSHTHTHT